MRDDPADRPRLPRARAWFGGALILIGGTLNVVALGALLPSDGATGGMISPVADSLSIYPITGTATPATSSEQRPQVAISHTHDHGATNPSPEPARPSHYETAGELWAGVVESVHTVLPYPGELVEGEVTGDHPHAHSSSPAVPTVFDMPAATHIGIPAVGVDAEIVEVAPAKSEIDGRALFTWTVADWAAGHHQTSADPGEQGNIVLSGHDDVRGEVFRGLHDIELGDEVFVTSPAGVFTYVVTEIHFREYRRASLEEQIAAGAFLAPMPEERLTLVTCWPYRVDSHRMIVVAKPVGVE